MIIEFEEILSAEEGKFVEEGFRRHSIEEVGQDGNLSQFAFVSKSHGKLSGILTGRLFWGSIHIKHLFVNSKGRRRGIGKKLMESALALGRKKHCRFAVVETMNFQALDFYQKFGFQIDFCRGGYDEKCIFTI